MNKLIEDFALESCILLEWDEEIFPTSNIRLSDIEKFAEFIIRECAAVVSNTLESEVEDALAAGCVDNLLKHFGVKRKKNRLGKEYSFVKVRDNLYRFDMAEEDMMYMRFGGKDGQEGIDHEDLGMFDPSGGPYVAVGSKIYWDEIYGATQQEPLIVKRIMNWGREGLFVGVEPSKEEWLEEAAESAKTKFLRGIR